MKIIDVEPIWLRVPGLTEQCEWGEDAFLVRVHTDQGLIGIGEADSSPAVMCALVDTPSSHSTSIGLREILVGENPLDIERLWRKMYEYSSYMGRRGAAIHAISAIDIALWDIASQYYGEPVHRLLGGRVRDRIPAYGTFIPDDDPDANRRIVAGLQEEGLNRMKLGGGLFGLDPEHDAAVLRSVRDEVGADAELAVDLVYRWRNYRYAQEQERRMSEFGLSWIEEPLAADDHYGLRRLAEASGTPITGGECLTTRAEFAEFIRETTPDIVQPDITRCGGITEMRRIQALADEYSTRLVPHGFSTGILLAATVQFLAATPGGDLVEYSRSTSPLSTSLVTNPPPLVDGHVLVSDRPGLGIELDEDLLERYRVRIGWGGQS
ncbi:L-alanine-DL-glutamate epimerase-like enolase superfamily enzyme [Rhodococcus sp. AG1013]|uniref:mandelate racemase/muconate lactonizing enzyme family protein n=1 Tax=Rhodococcus sp. AG1013 TaxID=2183996 RepID=UPI000E0A81F5|nr:mandelate racemase/muconate lactonizing enzyme family protein [Rhodococcus sp. AG1013]RDI23988.1 L-alanine-DL-glutamate epimerase-like enolase superfamily enzyme [Rhodococcus sp. AG1013]